MSEMPASTTDRPRSRLPLLIEVPAVVVTMVMMVHISVSAVMRSLFSMPLPYTLEITQYWYLPIVALLGFVAAQARGQHVTADLLYQALPRTAQRAVAAVGLVAGSVVSLGFAWFGGLEALEAYESGRTAGTSGLIAWPAYFLVPLAFGSLTVQFLVGAVAVARRGDDASPVRKEA